MFTYGFFFFSSFNLHLRMAQWTAFAVNHFWKCSWARAEISMTESCLFLRDQRSRACSSHFWPCLPPQEMSTDSLKFVVIWCTVDDGIFKVSGTLHWRTPSWSCSTICFLFFLVNAEPLLIFTSERFSLSKVLFFLYPVMLLTCCQLMSLVTTCLSSSFFIFLIPLTRHNFFRLCVAAIKFSLSTFFIKKSNVSLNTFKTFSMLYCEWNVG